MFNRMPTGLLGALAVLLLAPRAGAQGPQSVLPADSLPLQRLDSFRAPGSNWRIVGAVAASPERAGWTELRAGEGVLVNVASSGRGENLMTGWEHGDLDLELEFMMPRGSNSGIYLQGRYEVQLMDSWKVKRPTFSDVGGIYQRWDETRPAGSKGFQGHAPRVNASRAPGLWQQLRIVFRAPRFDAQGRKISNARFVRVVLNGAVIHENVEVTGPTRAAAFTDEKPTGPLMVQGDHGPVALRSIRYKRYSGDRVALANLRYRAYEGDFKDLAAVTAGPPAREGTAESISSGLAGVQDKFGLAFDGTVRVPTAGRYVFSLNFDWVDDDPHFTGVSLGGGRLVVGGREVLLHRGLQPGAAGALELPAGDHPFSLVFYKNRPWTNRSEAALWVEGPQVERQALHATRAAPSNLPAAILVAPAREPTILRSFVRHGDTKRTHAISVGDPAGVHYSLDVANGALLHAWRGPFVEATPMWHSRGNDQVVLPLGSRLTFSGAPSLARLASENAEWPDSLAEADAYRFRGYALDEAGRPTFEYALGGVEVHDAIRPAEDGTVLRRELRLRGADGTSGLYLRVAEGESIARQRDGSYAVGDRAFYVAFARGAPKPLIRRSGEGDELLVPVDLRRGEATVSYTIIW